MQFPFLKQFSEKSDIRDISRVAGYRFLTRNSAYDITKEGTVERYHRTPNGFDTQVSFRQGINLVSAINIELYPELKYNLALGCKKGTQIDFKEFLKAHLRVEEMLDRKGQEPEKGLCLVLGYVQAVNGLVGGVTSPIVDITPIPEVKPKNQGLETEDNGLHVCD